MLREGIIQTINIYSWNFYKGYYKISNIYLFKLVKGVMRHDDLYE
jgi:hypothetical protein